MNSKEQNFTSLVEQHKREATPDQMLPSTIRPKLSFIREERGYIIPAVIILALAAIILPAELLPFIGLTLLIIASYVYFGFRANRKLDKAIESEDVLSTLKEVRKYKRQSRIYWRWTVIVVLLIVIGLFLYKCIQNGSEANYAAYAVGMLLPFLAAYLSGNRTRKKCDTLLDEVIRQLESIES